ncbi:pilus assembly PilX N-terminal domain-containing protein, partial [Verrucomicrobiota bacterium]
CRTEDIAPLIVIDEVAVAPAVMKTKCQGASVKGQGRRETRIVSEITGIEYGPELAETPRHLTLDTFTDKKDTNMKKNESGMVLVVVVCLTSIAGVLAAGMFSASSSQMRSARRFSEHEQAFYVAEGGIECAASVLNTNDPNDVLSYGVPCFASPISFCGGTFNITVTDNDDGDGDLTTDIDNTLVILSTGLYENATRVIEVEMVIPFCDIIPPVVDAPLAYYGTNHTLTMIGSGGKITGDDYDVPASFACSGINCWGPLTTNSPCNSSVYSDTFLSIVGFTKIEAAPPDRLQTDGGILTEADWIATANQLIPLADVTITGTVSYAGNSMPIGTRADPKITVLKTNAVLNIVGTCDGAGIMILEEGSTFNPGGSYHYEGLVITFGSAGVELSAQGTPMISGAVVCLGVASDVSLTGSGGIRYSSEALANLSNLGSITNTISVASWREVK